MITLQQMFARFKNIKLIAAYFLLLIVGIINSREIMHSFVWHNTITCQSHADESGHVEIQQNVTSSTGFCVFCHIDFSIFYTPDQQNLPNTCYKYQILISNIFADADLPNIATTILLRGPPAYA